jgi:multiple sugar transport system permease protein
MIIWVVMIPLYIIFRHLGWIGSLLPPVVPPWAAQFVTPYFSSALAIFLLRQFFRALPTSLIEAAWLDGASNWNVLRRVVMPRSRGPIATVVILTFLTSWTAFIGPLIFINNQSQFTLSLGLQQYQSSHFTAYNYLMAVSLVFMIPTLIIFVAAQRHLIRGIAFSGLKTSAHGTATSNSTCPGFVGSGHVCQLLPQVVRRSVMKSISASSLMAGATSPPLRTS